MHILFLGIFVLFTIGFCTRVTSVLSWLAVLFYIMRTQQIVFGMDTMMNILLFYLMIAPCGAALSVDRLIARYRAAKAIARNGNQPLPWAEAVLAGPQLSAIANFAVRLFQIHFCFIYAASGLAKLKGPAWWGTTAAWSTIANPEFCPVHFRAYEKMLIELASNRPLLWISFMGMVYFTLFLEISLPFLVWTRMRPVVVTGAIFLHTGIAWVMGLTCFGLLMMTLLLCYFPASVIRERLTWSRGTGTKLTMRVNSKNRRHQRALSFLRALDLTGQITVQEFTAKETADETPAQLMGPDGRSHSGYDLIKYGLNTLVFGQAIGWMLWIPGVSLLLRSFTSEHGRTLDVFEPPAGRGTTVKIPASR